MFAGLAAADRQIKPDDPETGIRGFGFGGKVAIETWWNLGDQAWTAVDLSWGSLYQTLCGTRAAWLAFHARPFRRARRGRPRQPRVRHRSPGRLRAL